MIESTLSESTAKHPAPDLARHTLVLSRVNNTIACPVQNKENKKQNEKHAQISDKPEKDITRISILS